MSQPLIKVNSLTVNYCGETGPSTAAVREISFSLAAGATLGIIGESGAGKTTLANVLAGLHEPSAVKVSGEILFEGRDLLSLGEDELCSIRGAGIGMIFQDPMGSLDPTMPVIRQVAEPLRIHRRISKEAALMQAAQLLAEMGVGEDTLSVATYAHQLSGGLCQRAMIAAALACNPRVLIADEPTSALDTITQAQIIDLLVTRKTINSLAMIFISHDLSLVSRVADHILVMRRGEAIQLDSTAEVINGRRHPYTAELIAAWEGAGVEGGVQVGPA